MKCLIRHEYLEASLIFALHSNVSDARNYSVGDTICIILTSSGVLIIVHFILCKLSECILMTHKAQDLVHISVVNAKKLSPLGHNA
jgi:hypothetical protein